MSRRMVAVKPSGSAWSAAGGKRTESLLDVGAVSAARPVQQDANADNVVTDAPEEQGSPPMHVGGSALDAAVAGSSSMGTGWEADSDEGYESAKDWPASPEVASQAAAVMPSPAMLSSAAGDSGTPSVQAGSAAGATSDDPPAADDGALGFNVERCILQLLAACCAAPLGTGDMTTLQHWTLMQHGFTCFLASVPLRCAYSEPLYLQSISRF